MTLTRILPTLRRSIPDPVATDRWPEATSTTTTDVVVGGVSLLRLAELCGTPAVHLGCAVEPGTGGMLPSATLHTGVVVVLVLGASVDRDGRTIAIDADLRELDPVWSEARLIGRASVARVVSTTLVAPPSGRLALTTIDLPGDLAAGDLLALPYASVTGDAGAARPASGWSPSEEAAVTPARAP